jgi:TPP-dependent pyruvate/acetoin dehydrogenase alpha subunit
MMRPAANNLVGLTMGGMRMTVGTASAAGVALDTDRLLHLYREMLLIRRCEEQLAKAHQNGLIPGACHTYVGEEAIAVGICAHLTHDDTALSS